MMDKKHWATYFTICNIPLLTNIEIMTTNQIETPEVLLLSPDTRERIIYWYNDHFLYRKAILSLKTTEKDLCNIRPTISEANIAIKKLEKFIELKESDTDTKIIETLLKQGIRELVTAPIVGDSAALEFAEARVKYENTTFSVNLN